jgi:hypothetical protein
MLIKKLNSYVKEHGKAKAAVALGVLDTMTISNWIARKSIPKKYEDRVKSLGRYRVVVTEER